MEVYLANNSGFCFGVKRAVDLAENAASARDGPASTLGPLIHNPQVVDYLSRQGLRVIEDLESTVAGEKIIIRSHGVGPDIYVKAGEKGLIVIDATCPFVKRAQEIALSVVQRGCQLVIVGDKNHPEVMGILKWSREEGRVVEGPAGAASLPFASSRAVLAQTTQTLDNFNAVAEVLSKNSGHLDIYNTICSATGERQKAAVDLAKKVQLMVVVGGRKSANTSKLAKLCRGAGAVTYLVENAGELQGHWFKGVNKAGITAGASTPMWVIKEVETWMKELCVMTEPQEGIKVEGMPEENSAEANGEVMSEGMSEAMDVKTVRPGEIVKGIVVQVSQDEVLVDVGAKSEGVIPMRELSCCEVTSPQDLVKVGDEIEVYIIKAEDSDGRLILSKEKADAEKMWDKLQDILDSGEALNGTVREVVKGGLLVDIGVRAFLPASLVDRGYVEDLNKYLGEQIQAKVIEINKTRKKVILSRKAVLEEEFALKRDEIMGNLQENSVVRGTVRRLTNFGAFVDIGGLDGLLHISEMAWHRINHPSEVVKVGDELDVKILKIDRENEKISLGLKQVLANPWDDIEDKYHVGSIVEAKVVRLAPFGAFVALEPGVEGLVHISHLSERHVAKPDEVVQEGETVNVKVLSVDPAEKRIRLSIREAVEKVYQPRPAREQAPKVQESGDGGNVTIGDLFGDLGSLFEEKNK